MRKHAGGVVRRRLILALLAGLPSVARAALLAPGQVLRGQFEQDRHLVGFDSPLRSGGVFVLAMGRGLIWHARTPFDIVTVITPTGLAQNAGDTETLRLPAARMPFIGRFYAMLSGALSGDWTGLEPDFTVVRSGDAKQWRIDLTPKRQDPTGMPFTRIAVEGSRFVDRVRIDRTDSGWDELRFLDQVASLGPLSADEATAFARR